MMIPRVSPTSSNSSQAVCGVPLLQIGSLLTPILEGHGHVIFTSRHGNLSRLGTLLEIPPMAKEEGVRLLLRGYGDDEIQEQQQETASKIVTRLGHLALAIDQAAAYIKYKRIPQDRLGDFLTTFETERRRILSYKPKQFWEYNINTFTTWEMSFQQLGAGDEQWKKDVAHFLTLSAFFAPTSITESLFRHYWEGRGGKVEWMQIFSLPDRDSDDEEDDDEEDGVARKLSSDGGRHFAWDADQFWDVIAKSSELSLLQSISSKTDQKGANYSLHPLIRDWLQLRLKAKERRNYTQETFEVLAYCAKAYKNRAKALEERTALVTHMDVSLSNDEEFMQPQDRLGLGITSCETADSFAAIYRERGRYSSSEELLRRVINTRKSILGERHLSTIESMNDLALTLIAQQKLEEATRMYRNIVALRETEQGQNNPRTLESMRFLSSVLGTRGDLEGAEGILRQILTSEGPEPVIPNWETIETLALILSRRNKNEEAESLCRKSLESRRNALGKEHPETLRSMQRLAEILQNQQKTEEAEQVCRETLMLRDKVLGKEDFTTSYSMATLAHMLMNRKSYEEAEDIYRELLALRERQLGKEHPDTLCILQLLALTLGYQQRNEEAEPLYRELLSSRERQLGRENPDTLTAMGLLSATLKLQRRKKEAELVDRDNLILREEQSGREGPNTLETMAFPSR